jgi:hypothetical protein
MSLAVKRIRQGAQWSGVTLEDKPSVWQRRVLGSLLRLKQLPQSWDSYGSPQLQYGAEAAAAELIASLAFLEPPLPHVAPVPGGGVQFEWEHGNKSLEIEVQPDGSMEYLVVTETGQAGEGPIAQKHTQVPLLIRWLTASHDRPNR